MSRFAVVKYGHYLPRLLISPNSSPPTMQPTYSESKGIEKPVERLSPITLRKQSDLNGAVAIVTGSSRGAGPFIAKALGKRKMNLVLAARSSEDLKKVADEISSTGVRAIPVPTDLRDRNAMGKLVSIAEEEFGQVDVLVNNAGVTEFMEYSKHRSEEIENLIQVNLAAPMELTRLVLPGMIERRRGHIVNVASITAKVHLPHIVAYSAAKAGLTHFSHSLRAELHGTGVGVSVVLPGGIRDVGMFPRLVAETGVKPKGSLPTSSPDEVAEAIVRAIEKDIPEISVAPTPARMLLRFPSIADWMFKHTSIVDLNKRWAEARQRKRDEGMAAPSPITA